MGRLFVFIASFFVIVPLAFAQQTRFVDEAGVDEGDCTDADNPCVTIGFAIGQADGGDTIDIAAGAYTESISIDKALVLQGAGRDATIIQAHEEAGQAESRVITVGGNPGVEIAGMTIRYGRAIGSAGPDGFGGGLYNNGGSLGLVDVTFEENQADLAGGGMYNADSSPTLTDVAFLNNLVHGVCTGCGGGGMSSFGESSPVLTDVLFQGNAAATSGGGILSSEGSSLTLTNVTFEMNTAESSGGGLVVGAEATLTHAGFHNNGAGSGGGIFAQAFSSSVLTDVSFTENTAEEGGGMTIGPFSTANLTDVEFSGNNADPGSGGGMLTTTESVSVLRNVAFTENQAGEGGGLFSFDGSSTLTDVTFTRNESEDRGGGFLIFGDAPTELSNVTFAENTAAFDGGGLWNSAGALALTNVILWGNVAGAEGGGLYQGTGPVVATNVTYGENVAGGDGGGMFHVGNTSESTTLTNTIVWGNAGGGDGNDIFNLGGNTIELSYGLYSDEPGDIEGGGFEVENSLTEDPLFVDSENGDLRLMEDSPAVDAGDPDTDLALFPVNDDGDPIDLDGNPRLFGDVIDIGVYEHQGTIADETLPEEMAVGLSVPRPNPVSGATTFTLAVEREQHVVVEVFDVTGRRVQRLYDGPLAAGTRETLTFDASALAAGVYVIRATGEDFLKTRRVTVVH